MARKPTGAIDPEDMAWRGRIGSAVQKSRHSTVELTEAARVAFLARFEREVDPDQILDDSERHRRADQAKRAYFQRLARKSALARAARKEAADA